MARIVGPARGHAALTGTAGNDFILAYGDANTITGGGGDDTIEATSGNDNDIVVGMALDGLTTLTDIVRVDGVGDTVSGGDENVRIAGDMGGSDVVLGDGRDTILAVGSGNRFSLGGGSDSVRALGGNDTVTFSGSIGTLYSDTVAFSGSHDRLDDTLIYGAYTAIGVLDVTGGSGNGTFLLGTTSGTIVTHGVDNFIQGGAYGTKIEAGSGYDNVTFEADLAAQGYDDVKAVAVEGLLRAVMIAEENLIIGGNTSLALGITPTPSLVAGGSGTALTASALTVQAVALTHRAYANASLATGVPASVTRTNADGSTDTYGGGSAQVSAAATLTPQAGQSVTATVQPVQGAVGYAWYWGTGGTAVLGALTSTNQVVISAAATGGQPASACSADNSTNALAFDGIISQICAPGSGSYYNALAAGQTLTSDGAAGIVQINAALEAFWDNYRLSPDLMLVNSQELKNISRLVLSNGGAPIFRFNMDGGGGSITADAVVGNYLNPFTMSGGASIDIMLHPNVPAGTILFISRSIPYPLSNVGNVLQMKVRRDYYQIEWPLRTRMYEYGVYFDGVLQNYFPPAFGMITNITSN